MRLPPCHALEVVTVFRDAPRLIARSTALMAVAVPLLVGACAEQPSSAVAPDSSSAARRTKATPYGWNGWGSATYLIGTDSTTTHGGAAAAYVASQGSTVTSFATLAQLVRADDYRGHRVRWSGWVRATGIAGNGAGLWMRVDGPGVAEAFDNMEGTRPILGTAGWTAVSVVLDVPVDAIGISLGALLSGPGDLVVDDFRLDVVGADEPTTNQLLQPEPLGQDSAGVAATYERAPRAPGSLGFEALPEPAPATAAWLASHAAPLTTSDPAADLADLAPLQQMVGSARVVAMGEGTHGTREFFRMKHRVLEFLVREMGFTDFAMEAPWLEAEDVNRYVLNQYNRPGLPEQLIYYFKLWPWRTEEVADLIRWMREWNRTATPEQRVQFHGFDMQSSGKAIDEVIAFFATADPVNYSVVTQSYQCLAPYRDFGVLQGRPMATYAALPDSVRAACRAGVQAVFDLIEHNRTAYQAASGTARYATTLHAARLLLQWEAYAASASGLLRDRFMAENVQWLLDQAGPGARMMLWAHNWHVSRITGSMGDHLTSALGPDYVNVALLFGTGSFNAIAKNGGLQVFQAGLLPNNSLERVLTDVRHSLLFDARTIPQGGDSVGPLLEAIPVRSIGATFDPTQELRYFGPQVLPHDYDLLIFLLHTSASTMLPN